MKGSVKKVIFQRGNQYEKYAGMDKVIERLYSLHISGCRHCRFHQLVVREFPFLIRTIMMYC
jgi:hypothetical protein